MSQTEEDIYKARMAALARQDRLAFQMAERARHPERCHDAAPCADETDDEWQKRRNARKRQRRARRA